MTARTRQAALCMEAAERDLRAMATWAEADSIARRIGALAGVKQFPAPPRPVRRKVAKVPAALADCALCGERPAKCECDPNASWDATYARFVAEREAGQ